MAAPWRLCNVTHPCRKDTRHDYRNVECQSRDRSHAMSGNRNTACRQGDNRETAFKARKPTMRQPRVRRSRLRARPHATTTPCARPGRMHRRQVCGRRSGRWCDQCTIEQGRITMRQYRVSMIRRRRADGCDRPWRPSRCIEFPHPWLSIALNATKSPIEFGMHLLPARTFSR
jgi:hypothetical protein